MPVRWTLALVALVGLSGCLGSGLGDTVDRNVTRTATLFDGDVVVRGPEGYCIDKRSLRKRASQGFVVLASCESLSGVRGREVEPAIMTLTVLPGQSGATRPSPDAIAASMPGVPVITSREEDDFCLVHFAAGGDRALANKDPRHWRGAMVVNGHLVGLALYGRKGSPLAGEAGQNLLASLARNTKSSSPVRPLVVDATPAETSATSPGSFGALLGGLFPDSG